MDAKDFHDRHKVEALLAGQLVRGRLSLFLGAGISVPFGLPDWRGLLKRLYVKNGIGSRTDYQKLADEFFSTVCNNDESKFYEAIKHALYGDKRDFDIINLRGSTTLSALGALVMSSRRGKINEVFTFNFDDLLERYLAYHGFIVEPVEINSERFWAPSAEVAVYHAHGLVPSPGSVFLHECERLIFGAKTYAEAADINGLRSNQRMLVALQSTVALFVGLSGDDARLQSLLVAARKHHAYNEVELAYWGIALEKNPSPSYIEAWKKYGVWVQGVKDYEQDLPRFLFRICELAAQSYRRPGAGRRPSPLVD